VAAHGAVIGKAMTLTSGDVIVTGAPSDVGHSRKPVLYTKPGDAVAVEIERMEILSNPIADE
jgi:acylpyruvate hydrolase